MEQTTCVLFRDIWPRKPCSSSDKARIQKAFFCRFGGRRRQRLGFAGLLSVGQQALRADGHEPSEPHNRRLGASSGTGRVGARLLPEVPEQTGRLRAGLVECRKLDRRGSTAQTGRKFVELTVQGCTGAGAARRHPRCSAFFCAA